MPAWPWQISQTSHQTCLFICVGLFLVKYNVSAFSAFFHLLAMRAAAELAMTPTVNDTSFAAACTAALMAGRQAADRLLWNASAGFYRSYTGGEAVHADSLYAQVIANSLGRDDLQ